MLFSDPGSISEILEAPYQLRVKSEFLSELILLSLNFGLIFSVKTVASPMNDRYLLNVQHVSAIFEHGFDTKKSVNNFNLR